MERAAPQFAWFHLNSCVYVCCHMLVFADHSSSLDLDQCKSSFANMTEERDQLLFSFANMTAERDQWKDKYEKAGEREGTCVSLLLLIFKWLSKGINVALTLQRYSLPFILNGSQWHEDTKIDPTFIAATTDTKILNSWAGFSFSYKDTQPQMCWAAL